MLSIYIYIRIYRTFEILISMMDLIVFLHCIRGVTSIEPSRAIAWSLAQKVTLKHLKKRVTVHGMQCRRLPFHHLRTAFMHHKSVFLRWKWWFRYANVILRHPLLVQVIYLFNSCSVLVLPRLDYGNMTLRDKSTCTVKCSCNIGLQLQNKPKNMLKLKQECGLIFVKSFQL